MGRLCLSLVFVGLVTLGSSMIKKPVPVFSWSQVDFKWSPGVKQRYGGMRPRPTSTPPTSGGAVSPGSSEEFAESQARWDFNASNNVPMGVTRVGDRVFITLPRRRVGIPATLNYINLNEAGNPDVKLRPYPGWDINRVDMIRRDDRVQLVSVYRTTADSCNRLWMVDTGIFEFPGGRQVVQNSAIVVFDLNTNQMIHRYEISNDIVVPASTLASLAIDVPGGNCEDTYAYIPDVSGYALIVYSLRLQSAWRFRNNYLRNDPIAGDFELTDNLRFQWDDGIFSVTLANPKPNTYRTAFFHAMASTQAFAVNTQFLRNESNVHAPHSYTHFRHLGDKGPNMQTSMFGYEPSTQVIFYSLVNQNAIGCWNTKKPFKKENHAVLYRHDQDFIYPSDLTIDNEGNVWVMTNTMPFFIYRSLNPNNVNFRVWSFNAAEAIQGTKCA